MLHLVYAFLIGVVFGAVVGAVLIYAFRGKLAKGRAAVQAIDSVIIPQSKKN